MNEAHPIRRKRPARRRRVRRPQARRVAAAPPSDSAPLPDLVISGSEVPFFRRYSSELVQATVFLREETDLVRETLPAESNERVRLDYVSIQLESLKAFARVLCLTFGIVPPTVRSTPDGGTVGH